MHEQSPTATHTAGTASTETAPQHHLSRVWYERRSLLVALLIVVSLATWLTQVQLWWKASDDEVHQYFNALKLSDPEATRDLNSQALQAMLANDMEMRRIDRLNLRVDVTYNWFLTSTSIRFFDRLLDRYIDTSDPRDFSRHLVAAELSGFFLAFLFSLSICIVVFSFFTTRVFFLSFIGSISIISLLGLLRSALVSEYIAIVLHLILLTFLAYRIFSARVFPVAAALILMFFVVGTVNHILLFEVFDIGNQEIITPEGSAFDFLFYTLDTFIYPSRCCSSFGFFARSNFNLLLILVFALRWSDRYAASYLIVAAASVIHVAQSGLAVFLLIAIDLVLRPTTLLDRRVAPCAALALLIFVTRQGAWPSEAWLADNAPAIILLALLAVVIVFVLRRYGGQLYGRLPGAIAFAVRQRNRLRDRGPILSDLALASLFWLGLALSTFAFVKLLGRETIDQMGYFDQLAILGTPKRVLTMLQPSIIFGAVLLSLMSRTSWSRDVRPNLPKWTLRLACTSALLVLTSNAVLAIGAPVPATQISLMKERHEDAVSRPPYPDRDFSEANMYYLMALYIRTGHYVPNGFFRPLDRKP